MNAIAKSLIAVAIAASFNLNAYADDNEYDHEQVREDRYEHVQPTWSAEGESYYADARDDRREEFQRMDSSEHEGMRREMNRDRDEVSPREREEMRHEMRERFERMTPEQRHEMREELRHRSQYGNGQYYASGNVGGAHVVFGGEDGRLAIQRLEFMLGF